MTEKRFHRIGVAANLMKEEAVAILRTMVPNLVKEGYDVYLDEEFEERYDPKANVGIPGDIDVLIAVGGDGTILKHARGCLANDVPILGVKGGNLGFLAEGRTGKITEMLNNGRFTIQPRMRIVATVYKGETEMHRFDALNDIVVHGAGYSRMVTLHIEIDGKKLRKYPADGIIVATPTGSTAYSLSAGGPLLEPTIEAFVLTPLNPHTLGFRPIVVAPSQKLSIRVSSGRTEIVITVDGQRGSRLNEDEQIRIGRSDKPTRLVVPDDYDFFVLLNEKL